MSQPIRSPFFALNRSTSTPSRVRRFQRTAMQPTSMQLDRSSRLHSSVTRDCRTRIVVVSSVSSCSRSKTTIRFSPLDSSSHTRGAVAAGGPSVSLIAAAAELTSINACSTSLARFWPSSGAALAGRPFGKASYRGDTTIARDIAMKAPMSPTQLSSGFRHSVISVAERF